ncbi:hypothetical protein EDC01DRAFT_662684 [Geopyxis carbonaria]|nr:hypothetical protein EDC01DRAFT_662684 [Geopyxis carbonaria]
MDASTQASAALASLTAQLAALESQQRALLSSFSVTHSALQTLPAYTEVAPTLGAIPQYTRKLELLKRQMAVQTIELQALKRRAMEAGKKKRENTARLRERRREEGERDRTVLRARVLGEQQERSGTPGSMVSVGREQEGEGETVESKGESQADGVQVSVKIVKRRKKARKVEM